MLAYTLGLSNSPIAGFFLKILSPTLNSTVGIIQQIPTKIEERRIDEVTKIVNCCVDFAKADWNASEVSWGFKRHPLLQEDKCALIISRLQGMCS